MFGLTRARSKRRSIRTGRRRGEPRVDPTVAAESLESRLLLSASVLSYHNDAASDGQNTKETVLTPSNVNSSSFGKVFTTSVDGLVYGQPLFMPGLSIAGGVHDVVFAATEHDSVYALDAGNGQVLWQVSLLAHGLPGATSITTVPSADAFLTSPQDIQPEIGITSTPVIDSATNALYVLAATKETVGGVAHYVQRLHALDVITGTEKFGGPALIGDTTFVNGVYTNSSNIWVNGTGDGNDGKGHVFFNVLRHNQRAALTLVNGQLYIAWASYGDNSPYHGWIAAYNPTSLALTGVLNTTPNGGLGGIWAAGGKLASDVNGNLYVMTGNGTFDGSNSSGSITGLNSAGFPVNGDYGDSFLKITVDTVHNNSSNQNINGWGLQVVDYFTPFDQATLSLHDRDVGSGAPLVLPDSAGDSAHPHLLVGAGKQGRIFLLDRDNLGKFSANATAENKAIVQSMNQTALPGGEFGTPAYFNQQLYFVPTGSTTARTFSLPDGTAHINPTPASLSSDTYSWPGSTPSISANGTTNGIVWDLEHSTSQLRAYNATGYNTELYTSAQAANNRDALGSNVKFTVPTVINGHVYVGTTNSIVAFGLLNSPASKLVLQTIPTAGTAGQALSPALTVAVEDQSGKIITSDTSTVTIAVASGPGAFTAGSTISVAAVNGVATFNNLVLNTSGTYTLRMMDGTLTSATSGNVAVGAASASQLGYKQMPTTGTAGQALSPSVKVAVEDAFGNVVTGDTSTITIAVASGPAGFTAGSTTSVAAASGVATFSNLVLNTAGTYTLNASDAGLTGVTSGNFTVNTNSQPPVVSAPTTAAVNENASLTFSSANANAIGVSDTQAGSSAQQLALTASHGTLTLPSTNGLTFSSGSNGAASMTVQGTLANLNAALNGLKFTPTAGFFGSASLTVSYKDLGTSQTASASVAIQVSQQASQPTVMVIPLQPNASVGQSVSVAIVVTDPNVTAQLASFTFVVSFGDGTSTKFSSDSQPTITHVYTRAGTFTVSVTATDEFGHVSKPATATVKIGGAAPATNARAAIAAILALFDEDLQHYEELQWAGLTAAMEMLD